MDGFWSYYKRTLKQTFLGHLVYIWKDRKSKTFKNDQLKDKMTDTGKKNKNAKNGYVQFEHVKGRKQKNESPEDIF